MTRISDSKILGVCSKNRFLYLIRANKTCHEHHFTEIQWEYEKKTGRFRLSTDEEIEKYKKTNRNFIVRMNKNVNKTSNIIHVGTSGMLNTWENSLKQIVKFKFEGKSYSGVALRFSNA